MSSFIERRRAVCCIFAVPSPQCGRNIMSSIAETGGLAPLRAKSGWIVALGVVYVIAGIIALGSVVFATVVTVFVVGVMMLLSRVAEVISAFQIKNWGKIPPLGVARRPLHRRRLSDIRKPPACRGSADSAARVRARRLRYNADCFGVQHETRNALGLGCSLRRHYAFAWSDNSRALAGVRPLHSWALSRHRSHHCVNGLDRNWSRSEKAHLGSLRRFSTVIVWPAANCRLGKVVGVSRALPAPCPPYGC